MEQPWRCLEYARMEDCLQQRTRCVFHDNCSGKTRRVSPQGLLGNWSFDVQVDHPWRLSGPGWKTIGIRDPSHIP
ncbi:hypothetical protein R6Z07F_015436 [Ovis aries]